MRRKKTPLKIKLWSFVIDKKREIKGMIVKILKNEIHVEYKRFKGDIEPYYISYPIDTEELKNIETEEKVNSKYILSEHYLTIGKLKREILNSGLPDNAPVIVEMVDPKNNWDHKHIIAQGTPDECIAVQAWSANTSTRDKFLMIWLNY